MWLQRRTCCMCVWCSVVAVLSWCTQFMCVCAFPVCSKHKSLHGCACAIYMFVNVLGIQVYVWVGAFDLQLTICCSTTVRAASTGSMLVVCMCAIHTCECAVHVYIFVGAFDLQLTICCSTTVRAASTGSMFLRFNSVHSTCTCKTGNFISNQWGINITARMHT
jgi:hypothetical protein